MSSLAVELNGEYIFELLSSIDLRKCIRKEFLVRFSFEIDDFVGCSINGRHLSAGRVSIFVFVFLKELINFSVFHI